eukprot:3956549-Pyramimonas_sp.AAC.1
MKKARNRQIRRTSNALDLKLSSGTLVGVLLKPSLTPRSAQDSWLWTCSESMCIQERELEETSEQSVPRGT